VEVRQETRALTWDDIRNQYRIVCLGDSNTYGEDLAFAQAYPAVLAQLIAHNHPALDAVVINSGMRGHTAVQGLARLERDVLWYRPQAVVVAFGLNDARLGHWPLDPLREREVCGDSSLSGRIEPLLRHSHLWLTLRARLRRVLRGLGYAWSSGVPAGPAAPRVSAHGFRSALRQIITRIQKTGAAVWVLTTTPVSEAAVFESEDVDQQQQLALHAEYNQIIRQVSADCGAHLLDVHAALTESATADLKTLLAADRVHLSASGERWLAEHILQALENASLLGKRAAGS